MWDPDTSIGPGETVPRNVTAGFQRLLRFGAGDTIPKYGRNLGTLAESREGELLKEGLTMVDIT